MQAMMSGCPLLWAESRVVSEAYHSGVAPWVSAEFAAEAMARQLHARYTAEPKSGTGSRRPDGGVDVFVKTGPMDKARMSKELGPILIPFYKRFGQNLQEVWTKLGLSTKPMFW